MKKTYLTSQEEKVLLMKKDYYHKILGFGTPLEINLYTLENKDLMKLYMVHNKIQKYYKKVKKKKQKMMMKKKMMMINNKIWIN